MSHAPRAPGSARAVAHAPRAPACGATCATGGGVTHPAGV